MRINRDKQVGDILFIVEGAKTEFEILKRIFCNILHYQYVEKRRDKPARFINGGINSTNHIYVINTRESNISFISDEKYLDEMYEYLINTYDLNMDNIAIFYLFDRDHDSNTDVKLIKDYINELKDPYDNGEDKGGMLLLSYPAIESFVISCFREHSYDIKMKLGADVKHFMGEKENQKNIQFNKINEVTLIYGAKQLQEYIENNQFEWDIDNLHCLADSIFELEEELYSKEEKYRLVSLLVFAFLYLGIIEPEEGDYFYKSSNIFSH